MRIGRVLRGDGIFEDVSLGSRLRDIGEIGEVRRWLDDSAFMMRDWTTIDDDNDNDNDNDTNCLRSVDSRSFAYYYLQLFNFTSFIPEVCIVDASHDSRNSSYVISAGVQEGVIHQ